MKISVIANNEKLVMYVSHKSVLIIQSIQTMSTGKGNSQVVGKILQIVEGIPSTIPPLYYERLKEPSFPQIRNTHQSKK